MLSETDVVKLNENEPKIIALRRLRGRLFLVCALFSLVLFTLVSASHTVLVGIDWRLFLIGIISISGALGIGTVFIEGNSWLMRRAELKDNLKKN